MSKFEKKGASFEWIETIVRMMQPLIMPNINTEHYSMKEPGIKILQGTPQQFLTRSDYMELYLKADNFWMVLISDLGSLCHLVRPYYFWSSVTLGKDRKGETSFFFVL